MSLSTEPQFLKGVGPKWAKAMEKIGLRTVRDVLFHFPRRYEDRRNLPPIRDLRPGQWATVIGRLGGVSVKPLRGGKVIVKASVEDRTGSVTLTWFNQPWIKKQLEGYRGQILAYGQAKESGWALEIASPEWEFLEDEEDAEEFARLVPIYPLTEGLPQKVMRRAAQSAVEYYLQEVEDPVPAWILRKHDLKDLRWSLRQIHRPDSERERLEARKRLVFDEFFFLQVALAMRRAESERELGIAFPIGALSGARTSASDAGETPAPRIAGGTPALGIAGETPAPRIAGGTPTPHLFAEELAARRDDEPLWEQIGRMLPFQLTGAQRRVIEEIFGDMALPHPMNRLVQGDVGSGKTAVAACAMLAAVRSGYQAALMAPTEILAEQHHANLRRLFEPLGIEVALLVGKQTAAQKKKAADRVATGAAAIAVGTHALIQEGVAFARLGLIVVDEQHRFGVMQRKALRDKSEGNPDVLVMTATPIPRTLTMALYGDLELSVIDELPPGRKPVKTHWKAPHERESVYAAVRKLIEGGSQAYVVCPMVSESEKMLTQAAEELHGRLSAGAFAGLRVGLLHGQMRPKEKEEAMDLFRRHELDALVSTTVIEVGVDVPNANVMVVEDATRFGLSQLHQLRGRVGRGGGQSYCVLIADAKTEEAQRRMEIMRETNDGFRIADEDLKLRGPGELAGTRQSGNLDFKVADLVLDGRMLEVARQAAMELIDRDPGLDAHPKLLERVRERRSEEAVIAVS